MVTTVKSIEFLSSLDIDAMFFHSACNNLDRALQEKALVDNATKELGSLSWLRDYEAWDLGDEIDVSFSNEEVEYVEGLKDKATRCSGLFLQAAAATHMFCIAALEAHINKKAELLLNGKSIDHFGKLSVEGKWLFLPRLLQKTGFVPGNQPFQRFSKIIRFRNALVHYKDKLTPYDLQSGPIGLYETLGLTVEEARNSVEATRQMIARYAEMIGEEHPKWLKDSASDYLRVEVRYETV